MTTGSIPIESYLPQIESHILHLRERSQLLLYGIRLISKVSHKVCISIESVDMVTISMRRISMKMFKTLQISMSIEIGTESRSHTLQTEVTSQPQLMAM